MAEEILGEFEHIVLLAVLRLRDDAYGMKVRVEISQRTGRDVSIGAVYATLDRLAAKGIVRSELGEATAERGGRAKRTFSLTAEGMRAIERTQEQIRSMAAGLALPLGKGSRA